MQQGFNPSAAVADTDPEETRDWVEAFLGLKNAVGADRARFILKQLEDTARLEGLNSGEQPYSSYRDRKSVV